MAHNIPITNGTGSLELVNGNYTVSSSTTGYNDGSILPATQEVVEGTNTYNFTIAATGTLTLIVTDDGTSSGVPIEGATFKRADAEGNQYGDEQTSNSDGEVTFANVPFAESGAPNIYYVQLSSDGEHTFDATTKSTVMTESTATVYVENPPAVERTFNLTDANYENLPIADGEIILTEAS